MTDEERPTEPVAPRWAGSAPVPPPAKRLRRGIRRLRRTSDSRTPVDPWLGADRTLDMPPEELAAIVRPPVLKPAQRAEAARPPAVGVPPPGWVPPGWVPPPGWFQVRRRRRWPWVLLAIVLLTVGCCCGCPALLLINA